MYEVCAWCVIGGIGKEPAGSAQLGTELTVNKAFVDVALALGKTHAYCLKPLNRVIAGWIWGLFDDHRRRVVVC